MPEKEDKEPELADTSEEQALETTKDQPETPSSLDAALEQLEEATRERGQFKKLAQRAQADLINFRRRGEEERDELNRSITARLITKLLPVLDDLQRALAQVPTTAEEASWLDGIRLIEHSLQSLLESEGVTPIEADGNVFDPREHDALFTVTSQDSEAGTVVSVIRTGYKIHGKILRAAQVAVSQGQESEE